MSISRSIAEYALSIYHSDSDSEIVERAKAFLGDTFAVMVAGSKEDATVITARYAEKYSGKGECYTVADGLDAVDAYYAAIVNGVAAHIHDYDDVCTTMVGHPSVAVLPAVLAVSEERNLSGKDLLCGYITGIEVCALVGRLVCPELNGKGWHSTQTIGIIGATAAASCLYGLNANQLTNAIGIAVSEASGLKVNYGTMTKSFHAGRAGAKGIMAARLAGMGFTSSENAFEGNSGYFTAFSGTYHLDAFEKAIAQRNSEFLDPGLTMKPWPCCKGMHNAIWAMMLLMQEHHWKAEEIDHIDCKVLPFAKDMLIYRIAETPLQGKFSMNYTIAKVVLTQELSMQDFEGAIVDDPELIAMMEKVNMVVDETLIPSGGYYDSSECEQVEVYLKNGEKYVQFSAKAKGTPDNPMTEKERHNKMRDCMSKALSKETAENLIQLLDNIDKVQNARSLMKILKE